MTHPPLKAPAAPGWTPRLHPDSLAATLQRQALAKADKAEQRAALHHSGAHAEAYQAEAEHWQAVARLCAAGNTAPRPWTLEQTPGHAAYVEDCRRCPTYHDGSPRLHWAELSDVARDSWERHPSPREFRHLEART